MWFGFVFGCQVGGSGEQDWFNVKDTSNSTLLKNIFLKIFRIIFLYIDYEKIFFSKLFIAYFNRNKYISFC